MVGHFIGLLPCALKIPFEKALIMYIEQLKDKGLSLNFKYTVESNANNELDFFNQIKKMDDVDELPEIIMAPGFNGFFNTRFVEKFKKKKVFKAIDAKALNPLWTDMGMLDPNEDYTIIGFNPTVFLVDQTVYKDLPIPRKWKDLLRPEYKGKIAIRGSSKKSEGLPMEFCEGILLNFYKEMGEDSIKALGESVNWSLHPSQMVKMAGRRNAPAPYISAIPYSFARLVENKKDIHIIWPEDGAIINPIILLVKNKKSVIENRMLKFILSEAVGQLLSDIGFMSFHRDIEYDLLKEKKFKWLGWDFIENNDLTELKKRLNKTFLLNYKGEFRGEIL